MNKLPNMPRIKHSTSQESKQRIYEFLKMHPVGVLATVDPNSDPHGAVIYFSTTEDFEILFTTKSETKKHDNLRFNSHAMLVVCEPSSQTTVQIRGIARELKDEQAANEAFRGTLRASMQTSEAGVAPISKLYAGKYVAYQLKPKQIHMAVFARPDPASYDAFEVIEFH